MIALSDIAILTVSSALLAVALVRTYGGDETQSGRNLDRPTVTQTQSQGGTQSNTQLQSAQNANPQNVNPQNVNQATDQQVASTPNSSNTDTTTNNTQAASSSANSDSAQQNAIKFSTYTVRSGDSLSRIANEFGTTVGELQALNKLDGTRILVGQKLVYPER